MKAGDLVRYVPKLSGIITPAFLENTIGVVLSDPPFEFHGTYLSVFIAGERYLVPKDDLKVFNDICD